MASAMAGPWVHSSGAIRMGGPKCRGEAGVPRPGRDREGGTELREEVEVRAAPPAGPARLVADDAFLLREEPPAVLDVPGRIKIVERVEEPDEVAGLPRVQLRASGPGLSHTLGHLP